jgi:N-glycosidase YbiA
MINGFIGGHRFLSNFWPVEIHLGGLIFPTLEHAYQACKTLDPAERRMIASLATPGQAKRAGKKLTMAPDFDSSKLIIMKKLLIIKFSNQQLREKLLATGDQEIIEDNNWGDTFWGTCNGVGSNHLGRLLMEVRQFIQDKLMCDLPQETSND